MVVSGFGSLVRYASCTLMLTQAALVLTSQGANADDEIYSCGDLVVAGAGTGGLYAAWRLIETGIADPTETCIFEQTQRIGGRMRSVRGEELPEELVNIGSKALDVAAYRAWPAMHPFVVAAWAELGVESGCYHDIAFRTGDCTAECDPSHEIHKYLRDKYVPYVDTLDSDTVPYNVGVNNTWDINSTYLSPYDWLYGPYAPPFWAENFDNLAFSEVLEAGTTWAARDAIVEASRDFEIDGKPTTLVSLLHLATSGYNSNGVRMTQEDVDFYMDSDCSTGDHWATRINLHDTVVEYANYFANGLGLGVGGSFEVPVDSDGKQIGYDTLTFLILEKLESLGVTLYYGHQVFNTRPKATSDSSAVVKFTDLATGEDYQISTMHAVLNIPTEYILEVLGDGAIEKYGRPDLYDAFQSLEPVSLFKAYPFYEEAWWAPLGYTSGRMKSTLEFYHNRYHDGYASCTDETFMECSGVLLGTYTQGESGERWVKQFFPERSPLESADGLHIVRRGQGPPEQDLFLDELHAQHMETHKEALALVGIDTDKIAAPDLSVVGDYVGPTAGIHIRPTTSVPPGTIDEAAVEPFPGYNIHLVNEAYGLPGGWLQSSLYCAERMMYHYYGQEKATWLNDDVFEGFDSERFYKSVIGNSNGNNK